MAVGTTLTASGHAHQVMEILPRNDANVTIPPTDAELTTAAGAQPDGYTFILDDNGAGANAYLVFRKNAKWWYVAMTAAV